VSPEQGFCIGVDEELVGVEAMTVPRLVRPIDTIAVEGPRPRIRQIAVPDFVGIFRQRNAVDLANTLRIEETELDPLGVRREQGEIDALAVPRRAEGIRRVQVVVGDLGADYDGQGDADRGERQEAEDFDGHGWPGQTPTRSRHRSVGRNPWMFPASKPPIRYSPTSFVCDDPFGSNLKRPEENLRRSTVTSTFGIGSPPVAPRHERPAA